MTAPASASIKDRAANIEWVTLGLILACYAGWVGAFLLWPMAPLVALPLLIVLIALHASLTHEVLHGHPFLSRWANEALMQLPLNLCIPYERFRDLHLAHHRNEKLTDPYDDPETNYFDPAVWAALPEWQKRLLQLNNTLMGRILLGPAIGQVVFMAGEWRLIRKGDLLVLRAWCLHLLGVAVVLVWVAMATEMPLWVYFAAAYAALGLLRIRTFLEHQAHEKVRARTVIIEDRGPLSFLFLNNNLHVVHHMHPKVPWYRLPALYRANKARYLARNEGYFFASYGEVFRRYLWRAKDPVPHPIWKPRPR